MRFLYIGCTIYRHREVSRGVDCIGYGGTEFLGTWKIIFLANPRLSLFRPGPGFFPTGFLYIKVVPSLSFWGGCVSI